MNIWVLFDRLSAVLFADIALAKRLERTEGHACRQFAIARRKVVPDCRSESMECAGTYIVFDGVDSPVTQTFGLGLFDQLTAKTLDEIERFFFDRGAAVNQEICPLIGVQALSLICDRGYRPIEISNVLYREMEQPGALSDPKITVRVVGREEAKVWADINARGWAQDHPELVESIRDFGTVAAARDYGSCFLAEYDGQPGAAGSLCIHEGIALFGGAATVPEFRRRGLQSALLNERMRYAFEHGCDLVMMVVEPGSNSQRNAERQGLRIAYTRTKWLLERPRDSLLNRDREGADGMALPVQKQR